MDLATNVRNSNYHALQTQFTMRPTHGFSYQGTFTWSKSMGNNPQLRTWQDPTNRVEYGKLWGHRAFHYRHNGTIELPIGPNKLLLGNSSGWLARATERWQLSFIAQMTSGRPNTIDAQNMLLPGTGLTVVNGTPMIDPQGEAYFGPFPHNFGSVHWDKGAVAGSYFPPDTFVRADDPQSGLVTSLQSLNRTGAGVDRCTLDALARPLPAGTTGVPPARLLFPTGVRA